MDKGCKSWNRANLLLRMAPNQRKARRDNDPARAGWRTPMVIVKLSPELNKVLKAPRPPGPQGSCKAFIRFFPWLSTSRPRNFEITAWFVFLGSELRHGLEWIWAILAPVLNNFHTSTRPWETWYRNSETQVSKLEQMNMPLNESCEIKPPREMEGCTQEAPPLRYNNKSCPLLLCT